MIFIGFFYVHIFNKKSTGKQKHTKTPQDSQRIAMWILTLELEFVFTNIYFRSDCFAEISNDLFFPHVRYINFF